MHLTRYLWLSCLAFADISRSIRQTRLGCGVHKNTSTELNSISFLLLYTVRQSKIRMAEPSYGSVRRLMMFRNGCTVSRGEEEERTAGHRVRAWRRKRRKERMQRSRKLRETNSGRMEERERERESERGGGRGREKLPTVNDRASCGFLRSSACIHGSVSWQ